MPRQNMIHKLNVSRAVESYGAKVVKEMDYGVRLGFDTLYRAVCWANACSVAPFTQLITSYPMMNEPVDVEYPYDRMAGNDSDH